MTNKQYSEAQRIIGRLEGLAEVIDNDLLADTALDLVMLVDELYHPREEIRRRVEELKLKAGGNYNVKVDDEKPSSHL